MKRRMKRKELLAVAVCILAVGMCGCGREEENSRETTTKATTEASKDTETTALEETTTEASVEPTTLEPTEAQVEPPTPEPTPAPTEPPTPEPTQPPTPAPTEPPTEPPTPVPTTPVSGNVSEHGKKLIVIDAGHQSRGNYEKEPIGPGSGEMKAKVSSGTAGCVTGIPEYQITLILAQKLEQELRNRGYEVIMVRTSHDVNISNSERAAVANNAGADAFIRIHCNGSDDASVHGAMTLCQTPQNPYNGNLFEQSKLLSQNVLDELVAATGCKKRSIWETDTMSGINWCQVPVTIVEVGFMSNPDEDRLICSDDYQNKLAVGMANGIDKTFQ